MVSNYLFFLHFPNGVGISESELGRFASSYSILHSDTLYSAIFNAASISGRLERAAFALLGKPPKFVLSSAFPFCWTSEMVRPRLFLPVPKTFSCDFDASNCLICEEGFKILSMTRRLPKQFTLSLFNIVNLIAIAHQTKDRVTGRTKSFYRYRAEFADGWGLYFWVRVTDASLFDDVVDTLKILAKIGIGPYRSHGVGRFEFFWEEADDRFSEVFGIDGGQNILLSLYIPVGGEKVPHYFDIVLRRGWAFSETTNVSARRPDIYAIGEGAVLDGVEHTGRFVELSVEGIAHPVYRFGYAFCAPFGRGEKG